MTCKNCDRPLRTDYSFCSNCGAKIIQNRLTFKNLSYDLTERYFNIDNTFLKTFLHLFTKPEKVIGGYLSGVRKKYLNPISYFAVSVILSGIMFFVLRKGYNLNLMPENFSGLNLDKIYDYQALITYIAVPAYTLASYILFIDKNKYNLTEHLVINAYWLAQFTIVQFFVYIIVLGVFNIDFATLSNYFMIPVVLYMLFILKRLHEVSFKGIIVRGLLYFPMYFIAAMTTVIPIMIYLLVTGEFNIEDFAKKK
jgi:hypothetical protein